MIETFGSLQNGYWQSLLFVSLLCFPRYPSFLTHVPSSPSFALFLVIVAVVVVALAATPNAFFAFPSGFRRIISLFGE